MNFTHQPLLKIRFVVIQLTLIVLGYSTWINFAQALSFDEIIDKGEVNIAVYRDFPPFSYLEAGQLKGIDVEIGRHIALQLGVRANIIQQTADENVDDDLRNAIWKGHYIDKKVVDIMLHIPYDRQLALRNNLAVLFGPYYKEEIVIARNIKKLGKDATISYFRYEKIAVELDSLADHYLSGAFQGTIRPNLLHFRTHEEAGQITLKGEAAGMMGPRSQVEFGLLPGIEQFDVGVIPTPGLKKSSWLIGVAVKSTYRQLSYAVEDIIADMVRDGTMAALFKKHHITYTPPDLKYLFGAGSQ